MPDLGLPIDKVSITHLRNEILEESEQIFHPKSQNSFLGILPHFLPIFETHFSFGYKASFSDLRNPILDSEKL